MAGSIGTEGHAAPAGDADPCPKRMAYGPCGGVTLDGRCEVPGLPCPFVSQDARSWPETTPAARQALTGAAERFLRTMRERPVIVTDLPSRALDADSIRRVADHLAGHADAVLLGDHGEARVQFPPAYRAMLVRQAGLEPWSGLNCRDRNRVALEGELAALHHADATGVHCITGDHTQSGHRPDAMPVFDLDSTRLAALARAAGLLVSVAESPLSPPAPSRPERLAQKVKAGAHVCFVNHSGEAGNVQRFVAAAQDAGATVPFVAGLAVATSVASARLLQGFRSLVLPHGYLERILDAPDPRRAGIRAAIAFGESLLAVPGVRGLNLSSVPAPGLEAQQAADLAEIARALSGAG